MFFRMHKVKFSPLRMCGYLSTPEQRYKDRRRDCELVADRALYALKGHHDGGVQLTSEGSDPPEDLSAREGGYGTQEPPRV